MESNNIKTLIEKYWNCKTSVEEEKIIRDFFSQVSIPDDLQSLRPYFGWQNEQLNIKFEGTQVSPVKKTVSIRNHFYLALQVAASVLVLLVFGLGFYTQMSENKKLQQSYSDTYTDPEDALIEARKALGKISLSILQSQSIVMGNDINEDSIPD